MGATVPDPTLTIPNFYPVRVPPTGMPPRAAAIGAGGFVGKFASGSVNEPVLISSKNQLYENFGNPAIGSAVLDYLESFFDQVEPGRGVRIWVVRVQGTAASVTIQDQNATPADRVKVEALVDGTWANYAVGPPKVGIQIITAAGTITGSFKLTATWWFSDIDPDTGQENVQRSHSEVFDNLSIDKTDDRYFVTIINRDSDMIKVTDLNDTGTDLPAFATNPLASGVEPDYEGTGDAVEGFEVLENDVCGDISFVGCDSTDSAVRTIMMNHCRAMGDRQCRINPPKYSTIAQITAIGDAIDEERATVMGPWVLRNCPISKKVRSFPDSGVYLGINCRITPPESTTNQKAYGVVGLERKMTEDNHYTLQQHKISSIRLWPGGYYAPTNNITASSDPNRLYQFRLYMEDYAVETAKLNFYWAIGKINTPEHRKSIEEMLRIWSEIELNKGWIKEYAVQCDDDNNPESAQAAHKTYAELKWKLYGHTDYLILRMSISETVKLSVESAAT